MCYGKTICTRLQWRNVFEIRHYVIFKENKENRTSTDIGPTMAVSKKSSEEEEVEVIEHAERQMLQMEGVEGGDGGEMKKEEWHLDGEDWEWWLPGD